MGRVGAAMELVRDLNLETLGLIKTEALCGYPFDFTVERSEVQDQEEVTALRESAPSDRSFHVPNIPTAAEHEEIVLRLREQSRPFCDLQNLVQLLILFQEWRAEEDRLIQ